MFGTHVWLCVPMNPYIPHGLFTPPPTMHPQLILWGVLFCNHFQVTTSWGEGVPWPTSMMTTSMGGVPWSTSMPRGVPWSTSMMTTSMGGTLVHFHAQFHDNFHYHFWGGTLVNFHDYHFQGGYPGPLP